MTEPSLVQLEAICCVLSARVSELETSNRELRARLKMDPPPLVVGSEYATLKQAAGELGLSINGVKYHCRRGNLRRVDVGGRVFIERASMDRFKVMQKCSARASRRVG
ncbi:hypothetical protein [Bradyrhizobium sp. SZCCHNS2096]|uniref:hypothetical protein n=1 Tax=Bradyrhizobium sp. SZCCHNS2096 TaxID=3057309 RepID=UPI002915FCD6|nr:hypothetical protein [Bradyrhizobium sp. SZCCHNS2096]